MRVGTLGGSWIDSTTEIARLHTPTCIQAAKRFGDMLADQDYAGACALLTGEAMAANSPDTLRNAVEEMTSYSPGPIREVLVMDEFVVHDWPGKLARDVAVAYVALNGDGFSEAVSLTLTQEGSDCRIRRLEWGRP